MRRRGTLLPAVLALVLAGGLPSAASPSVPTTAPTAVAPGAPVTAAMSAAVRTAPPGPAAAEQYVTRVYADVLGRAPDRGGLATWTGLLTAGTPYAAVAEAITASPEYRSKLIARSYAHYLGRAPEAAGLASWLAALGRGLPIQDMEAGFVASPEFYAAAGSDADWVTRLYASVLGRTPGPSEVDHWMTALARGVSRTQVARGFLYSTEHLASVVDRQYRALLRRGLDAAGRVTWVRAIQQGTRMEAVIAAIVSSAEYRARTPEPPTPVVLGTPSFPSCFAPEDIADGSFLRQIRLPDFTGVAFSVAEHGGGDGTPADAADNWVRMHADLYPGVTFGDPGGWTVVSDTRAELVMDYEACAAVPTEVALGDVAFPPCFTQEITEQAVLDGVALPDVEGVRYEVASLDAPGETSVDGAVTLRAVPETGYVIADPGSWSLQADGSAAWSHGFYRCEITIGPPQPFADCYPPDRIEDLAFMSEIRFDEVPGLEYPAWDGGGGDGTPSQAERSWVRMVATTMEGFTIVEARGWTLLPDGGAELIRHYEACEAEPATLGDGSDG